MTLEELQKNINQDIQTVIKQEQIYNKETKSIFSFFKAIKKGI